MKSNLGTRILIVEDDEDVRSALAELLTDEGYAIGAVGTAEDGLKQLSATPFHLVITDYWLPGHTGAWMVQEAVRLGLLKPTQVLVITADPEPHGASGLRVLHKPLDVDAFLGEVSNAVTVERGSKIKPDCPEHSNGSNGEPLPTTMREHWSEN